MTHSRSPLTRLNCTGIAWYCPKAAAISKPWGEHVSCVKFKGHTSLFPPSLAILRLRKEHKLMDHWEYCFLSVSLDSTFLTLPLEMHWKAAHSMAKHTAVLLMPLVPLNMQAPDNGIHCTVATDFLTHLPNGYTSSPLCFVLCSPSKQWKWHWQQKGHRSYLDTYSSREDQPASSAEHIRMDFAVGNVAGTHRAAGCPALSLNCLLMEGKQLLF